jgi:acyl-coenzyme A thioesterase PaaI-like protein
VKACGADTTAAAADAAATLAAVQAASLPGLLGLEWIELRHGFVRGRLDVAGHHLTPTGYFHAATVVALADTCPSPELRPRRNC